MQIMMENIEKMIFPLPLKTSEPPPFSLKIYLRTRTLIKYRDWDFFKGDITDILCYTMELR